MTTLPADLEARITRAKAPLRDAITDNSAVEATVKAIIAEVSARGDAAVRDYSRQFDNAEVGALEVTLAERQAAVAALDPQTRADTQFAIDNVTAFAKNANGRIYLPRDDMARFGVREEAVLRRVADADFRALLRFQVERARALMLSGASLGWDLPGRIGLEIRAIVAGGLRILDKIETIDYEVFTRRPKLSGPDWPLLIWRSLVRPTELGT